MDINSFSLTLNQFKLIIFLILMMGPKVGMATETKEIEKKIPINVKQNESKNTKWETRLNLSTYNKDKLIELIGILDEKYPVLALSVAQQALMLVEDADLAKYSFMQIIKTIDKGIPFSLMSSFNIGNLRLNDYDYYSQTYNFYKAILSKSKKMNEWSDGFIKLVDKTNFNRYKYFEALDLMREKKYEDAKTKLRELLKINFENNHFSFVKKVARSLAQLHFTLKEYDAAKEIYQDFLLRLNPVTYGDWVELAWIQYYQNDFSAALGSLVNIEGQGNTGINLEPYIIKASIYKRLCDDKSVYKLSEDFNFKYKSLIDRVTLGVPVDNDRLLDELLSYVSEEFSMISFIHKSLKNEFKQLESDRSIDNKKLIESFFNAEMGRLNNMRNYYYLQAKTSALSKIVEVSESLRFLAFSAAREKYNPKYVFTEKRDKLKFFTFANFKKLFVLWRHNGYFFNDERLNYQVELFDQCEY